MCDNFNSSVSMKTNPIVTSPATVPSLDLVGLAVEEQSHISTSLCVSCGPQYTLS